MGRKAPSGSPKGERPAASKNPLRAPQLSNFEKVGGFLTVVFGQKSGFRRATGPPRGCNGVLVMLQRGRRCRAIAAPLQSNKGLTGPHPGPPQGEGELTPFINTCLPVVCKNSDFLVEKNGTILSFVRFENLGARPKKFQKWA